MKKLLLVISFVFCVFSLIGCNKQEEKGEKIISEDLSKYFEDFNGCFVLYSVHDDRYSIYNAEEANKQFAPCSTFKIYNALIGLETGIVKDENTEFKWDGTQYDIESWNQNHTLKSAIENSVVWYFKILAARVGIENMQKYLDDFGYGNRDISGGINQFWLQSSLKISPLEQIEMLKRLYDNDLSVSEANMKLVKELIIQDKNTKGILYGKTGSGVENDLVVSGWYVGYVELDDELYIFATHIQDENGALGSVAKEITLKILNDKNIWN